MNKTIHLGKNKHMYAHTYTYTHIHTYKENTGRIQPSLSCGIVGKEFGSEMQGNQNENKVKKAKETLLHSVTE